MAQVEAVRVAALQRHQLDRQQFGIGLRADPAQHRRADAAALCRRVDVEVVQAQRVRQAFEHQEADALSFDHDVLRVLRRKGRRQALAGALLVVAAQAREAVVHRAQPQREQRLEVRRTHALQREAARGRNVHPNAFLICSSTSLALAGIGVPGP